MTAIIELSEYNSQWPEIFQSEKLFLEKIAGEWLCGSIEHVAARLGVGKILLQAAEKLAAQNGKARMDLTTAKTNTPAQAAYESLGWVQDEVFYAYNKSVDA